MPRWADGEDSSLTRFRTLQLEVRQREFYEAYQSFRQLLSLTGDEKAIISDLPGTRRDDWISSFRDSIDLDDLSVAGHSFGGGTIVCTIVNIQDDKLLRSICCMFLPQMITILSR